MADPPAEPLNARLIDSLYTEALLLADEARAYFDAGAREDRARLDPPLRVTLACESLKVTTRLMHVVAWLLARRTEGSRGRGPVGGSGQGLGRVRPDDALIAALPQAARALIGASRDLYARVERLGDGHSAGPGPARALIERLERSL